MNCCHGDDGRALWRVIMRSTHGSKVTPTLGKQSRCIFTSESLILQAHLSGCSRHINPSRFWVNAVPQILADIFFYLLLLLKSLGSVRFFIFLMFWKEVSCKSDFICIKTVILILIKYY